jgi:hypothetical protein
MSFSNGKVNFIFLPFVSKHISTFSEIHKHVKCVCVSVFLYILTHICTHTYIVDIIICIIHLQKNCHSRQKYKLYPYCSILAREQKYFNKFLFSFHSIITVQNYHTYNVGPKGMNQLTVFIFILPYQSYVFFSNVLFYIF